MLYQKMFPEVSEKYLSLEYIAIELQNYGLVTKGKILNGSKKIPVVSYAYLLIFTAVLLVRSMQKKLQMYGCIFSSAYEYISVADIVTHATQ